MCVRAFMCMQVDLCTDCYEHIVHNCHLQGYRQGIVVLNISIVSIDTLCAHATVSEVMHAGESVFLHSLTS